MVYIQGIFSQNDGRQIELSGIVSWSNWAPSPKPIRRDGYHFDLNTSFYFVYGEGQEKKKKKKETLSYCYALAA